MRDDERHAPAGCAGTTSRRSAPSRGCRRTRRSPGRGGTSRAARTRARQRAGVRPAQLAQPGQQERGDDDLLERCRSAARRAAAPGTRYQTSGKSTTYERGVDAELARGPDQRRARECRSGRRTRRPAATSRRAQPVQADPEPAAARAAQEQHDGQERRAARRCRMLASASSRSSIGAASGPATTRHLACAKPPGMVTWVRMKLSSA